MKHERMTFSLCLAAVLMGSLVSFSCLMCLAQTYSMPCNVGIVLAVCCLASGAAAAAMGSRKSWLITLNVFLLYLVVMLWRHETLMEGFSAALYYITSAFDLCFQNITVLGNRGGEPELMFAALAIPLAWLTVWTVCKESYCVFVLLSCAPFLILSLVIVDIAANFWLVLLTAVLLLLIMSDAVRIRSANEGGVLMWWLILPVALLVSLLVVLSPAESYVRSDWSQMLQDAAEGELNIDKWRKQGTTGQVADRIDLKDLGPRRKDDAHALSYYSDSPVSYLRGVSYGAYNDGVWECSDMERYEEYGLSGDLMTCKETEQADLKIKTSRKHDVLYTTYYPAEIPDGLIVYDLYVENTDGAVEYTLTFAPNGGNSRWETPEYQQLASDLYLQIPEELREPLYDILRDEDLVNASAKQIADYVCNVGTYDLDTARVPDGEDFVLYFLTQSHRGYCVHFASSATLLLRAAGIPARYVTGYAAGGAAGQWNDITKDKAHAWVEYYEEGTGWKPLDPTPALWLDIVNEEPQPEEKPDEEEPEETPREPEQETPKEPTGEETEQGGSDDKTAGDSAQKEKAAGNNLLWLLVIPAIVLILLLRRILWILFRKLQCKKAAPNQRALRLWVRLVRLYKATNMRVPEELICLAEKAKFSQHELTTEELARLENAVAAQIANMKKLPLLRRLWHQYILALY